MRLRTRYSGAGEDRHPVRVAIAGGGIGGMALALSLHDAGLHDVEVFESASSVKELGVGINVLPHATRELTELGLLDDLYAAGIPTAELAYYSKHGQRIWSEPRGLAAGYRWPQFSIHRGELLGRAASRGRRTSGRGALHTGHHLARFGGPEDPPDGVWAEFVGPRHAVRPRTRVEADLLVGCDGIHSVVRGALFPDEGPPKWNGITMWRAVTEGRAVPLRPDDDHGRPPGRRMVVYPISRRHEEQGKALINWVAEFKNAPDQPMPTQDWEHTARLEDVLEPFASFVFDFLDVPALIRGAEVIYQYPMVDRDPLPTWNFGRVTLLGDAAHPMYPVGSNGASQAIVDARVLARELALQPSIEERRRGLRCRAAAADGGRGAGQPPGAARRSAWRSSSSARRTGSPISTTSISREELEEISRQLQAHGRLRPGDPQQPAVAECRTGRRSERQNHTRRQQQELLSWTSTTTRLR